MRDKDVKRFNELAADYETSRLHSMFFSPVQRRTLDLLSSLESSPLRLLDVGCGTGALLRQAGGRFPEAGLYGVDPAPEMVKVAQRLGQGISRLEVLEAPAGQLPFPDKFFDLVISTMSFHIWGDQERGLMEVCRVLSPGGALVLADTLALSWMRALHVLARTRDRFHTKNEVEQMLDTAGLKAVSWTPVYRVAWSPVVCALLARKPK